MIPPFGFGFLVIGSEAMRQIFAPIGSASLHYGTTSGVNVRYVRVRPGQAKRTHAAIHGH
jgi:hypothetical protein